MKTLPMIVPMPMPIPDDDSKQPAPMDTIVAVLITVPDKRHFEDFNGAAWLMDMQRLMLVEVTTFASTHRCTPTQALKALVVQRALKANGLPSEMLTCVIDIIRMADEYSTDKALWQGWLDFRIDPSSVRAVLYGYKLTSYETPARALLIKHALHAQDISLPIHGLFAQIARPHVFNPPTNEVKF